MLGRKSGTVVIYLALFMVAFLIVCALVTDIGFLYYRRAQAQKAADLAALAGASRLPYLDEASALALEYAARNGYQHGTNGVIVETQVNPDGNHPNWFLVRVSRPEPFFFAAILGLSGRRISATAIAEYLAKQPINIWGVGTYGTVGTQALEISGPYARYTAGDPYSTKYLDNGSPNPTYDPNGYNYHLYVPPDYQSRNGTSIVWLELYDATSGTYSRRGWTDEVYSFHGVSAQATTVFTIYAPDNTPNDYSDDVVIATVTIGPNDPTYKLKWVVPPGFAINTAVYGTGKYRINVKTTAGSGGNAYHMRAGPPRSGNQPFNPDNGTVITGTGNLQMFFQQNGTVTWNLCYIPREAAGMKIHIRKFDTDIGARSITYRDSTGMINWTGQLSTNGTWREDVFTVPANYPGGTLQAIYTAGRTDTSVWEVWYEGVIEGEPGMLRLVE